MRFTHGEWLDDEKKKRENKLTNRKALQPLRDTKKANVKEAATVALQEVPSYDVKQLSKEFEFAQRKIKECQKLVKDLRNIVNLTP